MCFQIQIDLFPLAPRHHTEMESSKYSPIASFVNIIHFFHFMFVQTAMHSADDDDRAPKHIL